MKRLVELLRDEDGQDGVEYALVVGFVSSVIVAAAGTFTTAFAAFWTSAATGIGKAATKAAM